MKAVLLGAIGAILLAGLPAAWAQNRQPQPQQQPARQAQPARPPAAQQPAPAQPEPQVTAQNRARVSGWVQRCVAAERSGPLQCVVEQSMAMEATGQMVMAVVIRIVPDTRVPMMQIQVPNGLYLPAGLKLRTDTGVGLDLAFQMCDQRGCFTGNPVSPELLAAFKAGKRLEATVQNMGRQPQLLTMPLDGFTAAYQKIQ